VTELIRDLVDDCISNGMGELDFMTLLPRLQHEAGLRTRLPSSQEQTTT
jgi:hypothetical protein